MDKSHSLKTEDSYLSGNNHRFRRAEAAEAFARLIAEDVKKRPQIYHNKLIILEGRLSPLDCCLGALRSQFLRIDTKPKIQTSSEATNGGIQFNLDDFVEGYVAAAVEGRDAKIYMTNYSAAKFPSPVESV